MTKAEKRRLAESIHFELDYVADLVTKLARAKTLCENDLQRATVDVLFRELVKRMRELRKTLIDAGVREPARNTFRR
jgi:hypothetical protein